ncbi:MAG: hypothetical protein GFH27_549305n68 [Chloroflexi bacterium AL-W]|nr:hypothetical protein [Chloroflexi bacterium AL-N1]NOK69314.1 hypothetical protein [Chloroflexi bacterium AL-N10]NOK76375.1 hypothetical protein [Chloroflexi bacterium AL-N5]NOK83492.1 hypothetical protein [Chloroflexi bacterium AL-W]NOK91152.1 hypothetical protein [Chloroflexi bacterium AL-N15]
MKPMLVGCPFDNGIRMMQRFRRGVSGAADAPPAVLALLNEPCPRTMIDLAAYQFTVTSATVDDAASIRWQNEQTLAAHNVITREIRHLAEAGYLPMTIGGDHSITYPLYSGVAQAHLQSKLGLIYIDAHLDMRPLETHAGVSGLISSGNAFRRILEDKTISIAGQNMVAIGIHRSNSTIFGEMEQFAHEHGVTIVDNDQCSTMDIAAIAAKAVQIATAGMDGVYLSVDIDAVEATSAPGVSAPAQQGLTPPHWFTLIEQIAASTNVLGFDLVEVSSCSSAWTTLFDQKNPSSSHQNPDVLTPTAQFAAQTIRHFQHAVASRGL